MLCPVKDTMNLINDGVMMMKKICNHLLQPFCRGARCATIRILMRNIDYRILTIEIPNSDWPRVGVIVFKLVIQTVSILVV